MRENIYLYFMQTHVLFIILSLVLLRFNTITATSVCHQLIAAVGPGGAANTCIDKERQALLNFKAQLRDPDGQLSTWKDEEDYCNWRGVTCDSPLGHVTGIQLFFNNFSSTTLSGEFSPSLLNLSYLNHLDLYNNFFHGTIPNVIGSMTQLTYLDLGWNQFTGTIPWFIGNLTQLTHLSLGTNQFTGTIPMSIGFLTKLTFLDLSQNSFSGTIPPNFGNLTNLLQLKLGLLGRCSIENLDWLSSLSHLNNLVLDGNSLAKANYWVNAIIALRKLSSLSLLGCDLSQVMHPYYSSPKSSSSSIATLYIDNNNLNSTMYHWLCPLVGTKLEILSLMHNKLSGKLSNLLSSLSGSSVTIQVLHATDNQLTGSLSDAIRNFSSIKDLDLSYNRLNGTISEKVWELPQLQELNVSSNPNLKLQEVNPSKSLEVVHTSNISCVENVDLSSCNLGPRFPKFIQAQKNLTVLTIANNSIADTIPVEFWSMWPSRLRYLDLSSNKFRGNIPDLSSNFANHSLIDLSSNNFFGPVVNVSSTVETLNLSKNKFSGEISFLCQIVDGFLSFLDLSDNLFTGQIPNCLWHFKELTVLNLGNNNLIGMIPASVESLIQLEVLYLHNNHFYGELPLSLKNCTKLTLLVLSNNRFSGNVPIWIGENLLRLYVLSLRANNFVGTIPIQICHLVNLQVLDLSSNNLKGTIPSCLNNITIMVQEGQSSNQKVHHYRWGSQSIGAYVFSQYNEYADHLMIEWHGNELEFTNTLRFLKSIDLSNNNLIGQIPREITDLHQLVALNLSKNTLQGEIPRTVDQMKEIQILDLSRNNFSGRLPSSMSQMNFLNYLDVSYNSLSGRIPYSTQLVSFGSSMYMGNAGLCGPPLPKNCRGDEEVELPPVIGESEGPGIDELLKWFYIGAGTGFPTAFWIVCSALFFNRRLRHAFFHIQDSLKDWVYVKVMLFIAVCKRVARA